MAALCAHAARGTAVQVVVVALLSPLLSIVTHRAVDAACATSAPNTAKVVAGAADLFVIPPLAWKVAGAVGRTVTLAPRGRTGRGGVNGEKSGMGSGDDGDEGGWGAGEERLADNIDGDGATARERRMATVGDAMGEAKAGDEGRTKGGY